MVGSHTLPPNLLRLFTPRPPLPYIKPDDRNPNLPLKSLSKQPPTLAVAETLKRVRQEKAAQEQKAFEAGENPDGDDELPGAATRNGTQTQADTKATVEPEDDKDVAADGDKKVTTGKKVTLDKELEAINKLPINDRPKARRELRKKRHEQLLAQQTKACKFPCNNVASQRKLTLCPRLVSLRRQPS